MCDGEHDDLIVKLSKVDGVGKSRNERPLRLPVETGICLRTFDQSVDHPLDRQYKPVAERPSLSLVP